MKKLFIGKLAFSTTEATLRTLFTDYEPLNSVKVITDKMTGDSRGFAFVEIVDDHKATEAITALNDTTLDGRTIIVNEARPQGERSHGYAGRSNYRESNGSRYGDDRSSNNSRY